jgi:cyclohexanone monooxygenase
MHEGGGNRRAEETRTMTAASERSGDEIDIEALRRRYAAERAVRLRPDGSAQYQELAGEFDQFDRDPNADHDFTRQPVIEDVDVLIIGGGFGGLLSGGRLRERGVDSIRVVEKGADFGGTWYWNRYPGASCDVESYIYMPFLEETGYIPGEKYARGPEILAHCRKLAERYDLYPRALFQTVVTDLRWDEQRARWIAATSRDDRIAARFVISACGFIQKPRLPGISGIESFGGHAFHTSRWDYEYTGGDASGGMTGLADKRVGIIGTGATAIQAVPHLAQSAQHLYVFQRTPASVDVRANRPTDLDWARSLRPGWQRERMANFTAIMAGGYWEVDLVDDGWTDIAKHMLPAPGQPPETIDPAALQRSEMLKMARARQRIDSIVKDKATAEALKPYYHYLCKRPCFHDEYLEAFNRDNVTLVDTKGLGVERITPQGVVVLGREYPVDCLIYATGFDFLMEYTKLTGFEIRGRRGQRLSERWADGTRTFFGLHTRGFPNLFMLSVVQASATYNYLHVTDEQANHLAHVVRRCLDDRVRSVDVNEADENAWVEEILAGMPRWREFQSRCVPSAYNYDGHVTKSVQYNLFHPAGPLAYIDRLAKWREEGSFQGLERTYETAGA